MRTGMWSVQDALTGHAAAADMRVWDAFIMLPLPVCMSGECHVF
jgi:hypothetical protein